MFSSPGFTHAAIVSGVFSIKCKLNHAVVEVRLNLVVFEVGVWVSVPGLFTFWACLAGSGILKSLDANSVAWSTLHSLHPTPTQLCASVKGHFG